ncbi:FAD-dependent oxidoreductase [Sutterella sp.]|uniref:FAD-dependent oxidoreductase n=1 Tax=Sutterella sp. TaxID=1981025 RepID=UPI0026DF7E29|nr:FAD-dependent oxidoreductase [Sutterella sp.]MDO5531960.1 FAD-dependent oxidoreductase [Sutterella sp.]
MKTSFKLAAAAAAVMFAMNPALAADQTYESDIVVIGAGASGSAAAWAAAEKGLKVVTLEKSAMVGGTGKFSEGIFAVESQMQKDWNYGLTKDQAFTTIMNYGHWRGNAKMVRAFVNRSSDTIDWMIKNGVKFEKLFSNYPNGLYTWHIYEGRGAGWINNFIEKYKNAGQTLLLNTWGQKLITENGKVVGVEATNKNGDKITIRSKATIIATGGFFDNKEMREKYLRFANSDGLAQTGKTGDGIQMAWAVGGGKEGTEVQASYRPGPRGVSTTNHVSATAKQPHLWLTPKGERFCNEQIMLEWPFAGNALERIGGTMYVVYDQNTLDHMEKDSGIDLGVGVMVPVSTKLVNFEKEWDAAVKAGWAFKADTLDGLAKITGMDPAKLKKQVETYNASCAIRHDEEFAKDPKYMREVKTGPFYAIKSVASSLGTLGGIKANERFEVVTQEEDPIPGLYAAGNDVGGVYGDSYDLLMAGSTVGFAVNSARIAVDSAEEYIKAAK